MVILDNLLKNCCQHPRYLVVKFEEDFVSWPELSHCKDHSGTEKVLFQKL